MTILVVGSVAFDSIKTPFGAVDDVLGGAASHFALAASYFTAVRMVAVVGDDFGEAPRKVFQRRDIDLLGLQQIPGKTFRWGGEYSFDLNNRTTLFTELNVFENFQPRIPEAYRQTDYLFLGNIHPELQMGVLEQVQSPRLVALDSMNYWIERTPEALRRALAKVEVLIINDAETRELTGEYNLVRAAEKIKDMGPRTLVIKRGEYGVLLFNEQHCFAAPAYPLESVFDPTGAGDAFAGGFLGHLTSLGEISDNALRQAVIFGSVMGSFCVEDFGTRRLENLSRQELDERFGQFKRLTHFDDL